MQFFISQELSECRQQTHRYTLSVSVENENDTFHAIYWYQTDGLHYHTYWKRQLESQ